MLGVLGVLGVLGLLGVPGDAGGVLGVLEGLGSRGCLGSQEVLGGVPGGAGGPGRSWGVLESSEGPQGGLRGTPLPSLHPHTGFPHQKLTWRSNQHDISICRMKGKHEVRAGGSAPRGGTPGWGLSTPCHTLSPPQCHHPLPVVLSLIHLPLG